MKFWEGLVKARSHIIFVLGLIVAFGFVIQLERMEVASLSSPRSSESLSDRLALQSPSKPTATISKVTPTPLTEEELKFAKIAWKYFENNIHPKTGLVNSVDKYPASTMWDTASYLMALISAQKLEIISEQKFDSRLSLALKSLASLPLFEDVLPNKSYNASSLKMVNYQNQPTERGIGWSAIDIGRICVPFNIIAWNYPKHTQEVAKVLGHWKLKSLLRNGLIYGAAVNSDGKTVYVQEGRLGYEEYASKSFTLVGLDVAEALRYDDYLKFIDIYNIQVPADTREHEKYHAHNYVLSEPYVMDGLEFGWDRISREFALRIYQAQEERFKSTGILTAVTEDNIDEAPYFVYNTVFTNGKRWNCITEKGEDASRFRSLSTKAAFAWHSLLQTPYTKKLIEKIKTFHDPKRGWFSGVYEASGEANDAITCNSNAVILESLCFKQFGKMITIF